MLERVLAGIVSTAFELAVVAAATAGISAALISFLRLQVATYRRALSNDIKPRRRKHYQSRGLQPTESQLNQLAEHEAVELLSNGAVFRQRDLPRWTLNLTTRIEAAFENPDVLTDTDGTERKVRKAEILAVARAAETRYETRRLILCCLVGIVFCFALDWALLGNQSALIAAFSGADGGLGTLLSRLLTGLAGGALASVAIALQTEPRLGRDRAPPRQSPLSPPPMPEAEFKVGTKDQPIRAINFSSGAYDTVMQLGVIHALCVIQAKAPDAVVGLSVGAVNAAALAEVLQSGAEVEKSMLTAAGKAGFDELRVELENGPQEHRKNWLDLQRGIQSCRLIARAKRLRSFIEAAHVAPERLVKALLPDAYQVDTVRPLAPLRQPRLAREERTQRAKFVSARSGLARLYNQVLDVSLTFGTLTKVIRRVLGIRAAGDYPTRFSRVATRVTESLQLWVLLAKNFWPAASLIVKLSAAYLLSERSRKPATAAVLIFRSRAMEQFWKTLWTTLTCIALAAIWFWVSLAAWPLWAILGLILWFSFRSLSNRANVDVNLIQSGTQDGQAVTRSWARLTALGILILSPLLLFDPLRESLLDHPVKSYLIVLVTAIGAAVLAWLISQIVGSSRQGLAVSLLAPFDLNRSWFGAHGVRSYLIDLFDRGFHGTPTMDQAVDAAMQRKDECNAARPVRKKSVSFYWHEDRLERILVGLSVANTETKGLNIVPGDAPLIEGLAAATALTPYLPPVELETIVKGHRRKVLYIDGSKVSHEPTHSLLQLIRKHRNDEHGPLHVYSVTPFPSSRFEVHEGRHSQRKKAPAYLDLIGIVRRALVLQRFRDSKLERRLTTLVSRAMPPKENACDNAAGTDKILRTWIVPVELESDAAITHRILGAKKETRRRLIEETIADGCRAAIQVMIPHTLNDSSWRPKCATVVGKYLDSENVPNALHGLRLSGNGSSPGPGLHEICTRCSLNRASHSGGDAQALRNPPGPVPEYDWPHERTTQQTEGKNFPNEEPFPSPPPPETDDIRERWKKYFERDLKQHPWPRGFKDGKAKHDKGRPTISLLFSGGVFRGVFQLGVLSGLSEIGLKIDLVAGASVGSLTAAMAARAFERKADDDVADRRERIARMASAFLTIDRLILTDRFADFARNLTIRAADTRFSLRDADHVFRRYDQPTFAAFDRRFRNVVAGIERLLYVAPFELREFVRAYRTGDRAAAYRQARRQIQHFLDRMQVGEEALGAEALQLLVERHVAAADDLPGNQVLTTDSMRERHGIQFLATTTNLNRGRLEILGEAPATDTMPAPPLLQALLASSAFPGVFRPRWAWELSAHLNGTDRYIDGGVMDNLPVDAVAQFLVHAEKVGMIEKRPPSPHLIIAGSLEVDPPDYSLTYTRERLKNSWLRLRTRVNQLHYNTKLDAYETAEKSIQHLLKLPRQKNEKVGAGEKDPADEILDLQILSIRPNWLCGTFAVHPMLGFRRQSQMKNIAHGCAATLLRFSRLRQERSDVFAGWGVQVDKLPAASNWSEAFAFAENAVKQKPGCGNCWLRPNQPCPFSRGELQKLLPALEPAVVDNVSRIHEFCAIPETHLKVMGKNFPDLLALPRRYLRKLRAAFTSMTSRRPFQRP